MSDIMKSCIAWSYAKDDIEDAFPEQKAKYIIESADHLIDMQEKRAVKAESKMELLNLIEEFSLTVRPPNAKRKNWIIWKGRTILGGSSDLMTALQFIKDRNMKPLDIFAIRQLHK